MLVAGEIAAARRRIAGLVGLSDPTHLIFTTNCTDSLNLVIHGLLAAGDHVVTSVIEHNSVLRPLAHLETTGRIEVTRVGCDDSGVIDPADVKQAIRSNTRLVAIAHASNVTGAIQPIAEIGRLAREAGVLVCCDAAQTLGHVPLDMAAMSVDFLAASGHKGLLGPLGTGILAIRPGAADLLDSTRQGGTGTRSEQTRQPDELPSKFESGNLNVPGIVGMNAGAEYLVQRGIEDMDAHGRELIGRLLTGLRELPGVRVFGPASVTQRVPLVSITLDGYDPQEAALALDVRHRIQARPGLHCAAAMHERLKTVHTGGTVRFSLGAV